MKKIRTFKAFTLIEMIVVIVIFGILMSALMNFFKPVRQTYVDSTLYEKQRTTQNGIIEYLCESTRYAEKMIIYDQGKGNDHKATPKTVNIANAKAAYEDFLTENGISLTDPKDLAKRKRVRIIVINRSNTFDLNGYVDLTGKTGKRGRIITNVDGMYFGGGLAWQDYGLRPAGASAADADSYMALGGAYYGDYDYDIYIDVDKTYPSNTYDKGITFGVVTSLKNTGNVVKDGGTNGGSKIDVNGDNFILKTVEGNLTRNLSDVTYYYDTAPHGSTTATGTITGGTKNTYIVFMVPDEGDR